MKYVKKQEMVDAVQFGGSEAHISAVRAWMETGAYTEPKMATGNITTMPIRVTSGCVEHAEIDDWIIRHDENQYKICSNDFFEMVYNKVAPVDDQWMRPI